MNDVTDIALPHTGWKPRPHQKKLWRYFLAAANAGQGAQGVKLGGLNAKGIQNRDEAPLY